MTLDQFILKEQKRQEGEEFQKGLAWYKTWVAQQVAQDGFFSISIEPHTHHQKTIAVTLHGAPISFEERKRQVFHNHDYFELMYVYRGNCTNRFQDGSLRLCKGDLLLLNPNILHCPYTTDQEDVLFNIMLSRELFENTLMPLIVDNSLFTNFFSRYFYQVNQTQDYLLFPALHASHSERIQRVVQEIIEEEINRSVCYEHVIQSSLVVLFALLTRSYSEQHDIGVDMGDRAMLIANVLSYTSQHCADISLKQLEREFSYSSGYLSKLIQKHTGKSFSELVTHFRLEKVRCALDSSALPIPELVRLSGFNDLSYLNKAFKKRYGLTPAQYKKRMGPS